MVLAVRAGLIMCSCSKMVQRLLQFHPEFMQAEALSKVRTTTRTRSYEKDRARKKSYSASEPGRNVEVSS